MAIKRFDYKNSLIEAMRNGLNLFVGAGFSLYAKDKEGVNLPTGKALLNELHQHVGPGLNDLQRYCSVMERKNRTALNSYLTSRFSVGSFDPAYLNLNLINIKGVYTTNIDDLVPQIVEKSVNRYINEQNINGDSSDSRAVNYLPLHGYVKYPENGYVFSVEKIANIYNQATRIWSYLSAAIEKYPTLFIGYGLNDTGVIEAITSEQTFHNAQKAKWIVLYQPTADDITYFEGIGFNIIISEAKEFLEELASLDSWMIEEKDPDADLKEYLGANMVPKDARNQTQRPIEEFYRGFQPIWSDILRNVIYKTSHYQIIEDSIFNKEKQTIIIGSPISGKSTLVMQVAKFIHFGGIKLMFTEMTAGRAEYIKKLIDKRKALIVIENFTDDVGAFKLLCDLPNAQVVGIDRSYNFGYVCHLFDENKYDIINVTTLSDYDIQGIIDTIPEGIRRDESEIRQIQYHEDDSIFEFVIRHIKGENVKTRYKQFINKLENDDTPLAEFLVLCAYMHKARVPLSMEVVYSYFDEYSYQEIFEMRDQLSDFLKEDTENIAHNDIEGYRPRSSITADSIIDSVSPKLLARVMSTLIEKVAYIKICNYRTFKRWGFDKAIVSLAFPNWREGKKFYEKAFVYDNRNPYVLQQGALYLSSKHIYEDAFGWIDKAKVMTNDRQFSIRNSHAIILFDANFDVNTKDAIEQLDNSMEILHKCFDDDMRKTFHAKTYADQALRYYRKYNNDKAFAYLIQSKEWLEGEIMQKAWANDLKSLLHRVNNALMTARNSYSTWTAGT